ncbi:glycosyltransferase family 2 protein [Enterococcus sp.]|uniref:glycosyltransferase family 2 protein n=1 Tax=Enterococcus sp. TaxID=35783 RepID=UPI003C729E49
MNQSMAQDNMKNISIIVPFFNAESYIKHCLDALITQTDNHFEIILIDDGSTDKTAEIITNNYLNLYSTIIYEYQENAGVSSARNRGIELATSEYIIFVDADDVLEPDFIERFKYSAKINNDLVCCSYFIDYPREHKSIIKKFDPKILENDISQIIFEMDKLGMLNVVWNKMFRKSIIKDNEISFDSSLKSGEDLVFVLNYCQYIQSINIISKPLYHYLRIENNSTLMSYIENLAGNLEVSWNARQNFYRNSNLEKKEYEYFLARIYLSEKISILNNSYRREAPQKERKKIIYGLLSDEELIRIIKFLKPKSFSEKIFYYAINKGNRKFMITIYNLLFFFRNRFSWLYTKLRFKII